MSKSLETYQDLLYGFNPSRSSVCSLKSGIFCFSWTEFLQVTTGKGTELSLTTFSYWEENVNFWLQLCVWPFVPTVSLLPLSQSYVSNIQKDSLWPSAGLAFYFWSEICFDINKVTWASFWLVFSWYDFYLSTINLLLKWLTVPYLQVTFESQILTQQTWLKVDDLQSLVLPYLYLMYYWYFRFKPNPFLFSFFHFLSPFFSYFGLCFYALK